MCSPNVQYCTLQCWLRCSGHQLHSVSVSSGPKLAFLAFSTFRTLLKTSQASKISNRRLARKIFSERRRILNLSLLAFPRPHGGLTFIALWTDLALIRDSKRTQALSFTSSILKTLWCSKYLQIIGGEGATRRFFETKNRLSFGGPVLRFKHLKLNQF